EANRGAVRGRSVDRAVEQLRGGEGACHGDRAGWRDEREFHRVDGTTVLLHHRENLGRVQRHGEIGRSRGYPLDRNSPAREGCCRSGSRRGRLTVSSNSRVICSRLFPAVPMPSSATASAPATRTTVVMRKTPPNPIRAKVEPMTMGAESPPMRPKAEATPMPVVRNAVGYNSGV